MTADRKTRSTSKLEQDSGYRRRERRRTEIERMQFHDGDRIRVLQPGQGHGRCSEQRRKVQATMTIMRMPVGIRVIRRSRAFRKRMMLFVHLGGIAIVHNVDGIAHAFEPRRKQPQNDQRCYRIPHRFDRPRSSSGMQGTGPADPAAGDPHGFSLSVQSAFRGLR